MKNSTSIPGDDKTPTDPIVTAPRRAARSFQHRTLIAVVTVATAWLSYQSVNEAIGLYRLLDQTQEAMSEAFPAKSQADTGLNKTETNHRVTGL